ncbi:glutamine synthetase family protein [Ovoidimarina sediminis]|uniref:glutamine synthetase family protein n=1 Tax=Ovoidimarina sediminis TaxID=3079856 RepID=UPI00290A06E4|nr:glutamine synthetase family protein [Rhodophyticola sp. MJ-SS7]MDU8943260.1 glutamine synthetase family protein [Rhodophyticola sp. MJ-SS7]
MPLDQDGGGVSGASVIDGGLADRNGLYSEEDKRAIAGLLDRIGADGIEVIRLSFADQHGVLRGKSITARALVSAFRSGMTMTSTLLLKDTSHRTVFPVWDGGPGIGDGKLDGAGDLLIFPDPGTFRVLPWAESTGWLLCDVRYADGSPCPFCTRTQLAAAVGALAADGKAAVFGLEVEFHIHRMIDPRLGHEDAGMPGAPPLTEMTGHGYQYLTEARIEPLDQALNAIRTASEALGIKVRSMEVEFGPSQVEMTFDPGDPVSQADAMVLFRAAAKETCRRLGLHATFMCRPAFPAAVPSGWHIHQSLFDAASGVNLFLNEGEALAPAAAGWIAGLLDHAPAACLLTNPTVNAYKRFQPGMLAPDRIQWARDNKGAMVRSLIRPGDPASRIENRVAEPAANPYLAFAAQIRAGQDGLSRALTPPPPARDPYQCDAPRLPADLGAAIDAFEASALWADTLGADVVEWLATLKRAEWRRYLSHVSDWEQAEYYRAF